MLKPNLLSFLHRINIKRLFTIVIIIGCVFLLAGGFNAVQSYFVGATSYSEYRMNTLSPLFAGSILMGSFGLMYAYKNRANRICLIGFGVTLFCYGFIEYLFQAIGGVV